MKTIIAGSRDATIDDVRAAVDACPFKDKITEVISGAARGADTFGEQIAAAHGWPVTLDLLGDREAARIYSLGPRRATLFAAERARLRRAAQKARA